MNCGVLKGRPFLSPFTLPASVIGCQLSVVFLLEKVAVLKSIIVWESRTPVQARAQLGEKKVFERKRPLCSTRDQLEPTFLVLERGDWILEYPPFV